MFRRPGGPLVLAEAPLTRELKSRRLNIRYSFNVQSARLPTDAQRSEGSCSALGTRYSRMERVIRSSGARWAPHWVTEVTSPPALRENGFVRKSGIYRT